LGATVYYIVAGKELLRLNHLELMAADASNLTVAFAGNRWRRYPVSLQALVTGMLHVEADQRPTIGECLSHAFFTEVLEEDWIANENGDEGLRTGDLDSGVGGRTFSGGDNTHR
jgi:hypothetical protein